MSAVTNRRTADHYTWGGACDGWRLLAGDDLIVTEERIPPGGGEVAHFHAKARQLFYVLRGELTMDISGASHVLAAGDALEIVPGATHRAYNAGAANVDFLVISAPTTAADRVNVASTGR